MTTIFLSHLAPCMPRQSASFPAFVAGTPTRLLARGGRGGAKQPHRRPAGCRSPCWSKGPGDCSGSILEDAVRRPYTNHVEPRLHLDPMTPDETSRSRATVIAGAPTPTLSSSEFRRGLVSVKRAEAGYVRRVAALAVFGQELDSNQERSSSSNYRHSRCGPLGANHSGRVF
jgi:hypothetical protein